MTSSYLRTLQKTVERKAKIQIVDIKGLLSEGIEKRTKIKESCLKRKLRRKARRQKKPEEVHLGMMLVLCVSIARMKIAAVADFVTIRSPPM